jgi:1,4-dihydroxy-2-naphthoate polyprenyltransferase
MSYGSLHEVIYLALATEGELTAHFGIHAFDDYSDHMTGIDLKIQRTSFSGGSGVLPSQEVVPIRVHYSFSC